MDKPKPKIVFEESFKCPHCKKKIIVKKKKTKISEAVAAEYNEEIIVEKDSQTTLKK